MKLSIVVPLYNEVDNVAQLVKAISIALESVRYDYELIAVDDGSTDGTRALLAQLVETNPRLRVIELRRNYGQTAAMSAGIEHAAGEVIDTIKGDLTNDTKGSPI